MIGPTVRQRSFSGRLPTRVVVPDVGLIERNTPLNRYSVPRRRGVTTAGDRLFVGVLLLPEEALAAVGIGIVAGAAALFNFAFG